MEFKEIEYKIIDDIAIITFNRPEVMNCVGPNTHDELIRAWRDFKTNDKLKVAIITGAGDRAFCSGWACYADMRIAEEHASFGVTCRRWNIGLADGGTQRLPRIVGMGRAMELIITGKVIDAHEAYRIGLANEVVPKGTSLNRALELAEFICTLPQPAIRTDKEAAVRGFGEPLDEGLRIEAEKFLDSIHRPETMEGLKQFNHRLHPDRQNDQETKTPGIVRAKK